MSPSRRAARRSEPRPRQSRRRVLHLGAVALAGSLAGCTSGMLDEESGTEETRTTSEAESPATETAESSIPESTGTTRGTAESDEKTTLPTGVDTSLPEGSVEFPEGPKSRPERPADLTAESVREYVHTFEYRYVYNRLHYDDSTEVHEECGVESVEEYGEGFRVVVWCSAYSNTERDGEKVHADYFTQYATYFVGPDSTVRREGRSGTRE